MSNADNKKFPEPELTAKKMVPTKEFGLLKVAEWPDGTVIHLNTKKGEENLRIYHSSGSLSEFRSDGTHVSFTSNNGITYSKGGITVSYDHSGDSKAAGHARISLGHDAHIEVAKNANIVVNGRADVHSTGHLKLSAADLQLSTSEGSLVFASARDIEFKADSRVLMHSKAVTQITSDADVHIESGEDTVIKSAGAMTLESQAKMKLKSAATAIIKAAKNLILFVTDEDIFIRSKKKNIHVKAELAAKVTPSWTLGAEDPPEED